MAQVRFYTYAHKKQTAACLLAAWETVPEKPPALVSYLADRARTLRCNRKTGWNRVVVGDQDVVVAMMFCTRHGSDLFIDLLAVHPEHQRKGHGKALLDDAVVFAKETHLTHVWLYVDDFM